MFNGTNNANAAVWFARYRGTIPYRGIALLSSVTSQQVRYSTPGNWCRCLCIISRLLLYCASRCAVHEQWRTCTAVNRGGGNTAFFTSNCHKSYSLNGIYCCRMRKMRFSAWLLVLTRAVAPFIRACLERVGSEKGKSQRKRNGFYGSLLVVIVITTIPYHIRLIM